MALGDVYRDAAAGHRIDPASSDNSQLDLNELLTVDEVAALLKVSRSWVYEHSRSKQPARSDRLPHIKIGKYLRFDARAVRAFLQRKPISPHNVTRRWIVPACTKLGLPKATWLTFRRTYASWSHDKGVLGKVVAKLMGHTNADVTLNVYTQAMDDSLRTAVDRVGNELFNIVHCDEGSQEPSH